MGAKRTYLTGLGAFSLAIANDASADLINLIQDGEFEAPAPPGDITFNHEFSTWDIPDYSLFIQGANNARLVGSDGLPTGNYLHVAPGNSSGTGDSASTYITIPTDIAPNSTGTLRFDYASNSRHGDFAYGLTDSSGVSQRFEAPASSYFIWGSIVEENILVNPGETYKIFWYGGCSQSFRLDQTGFFIDSAPTSSTPPLHSHAIPEPGTFGLLAVGLALIRLIKRPFSSKHG